MRAKYRLPTTDDSQQIAMSLLGTLLDGVNNQKYQGKNALDKFFSDALDNSKLYQGPVEKPDAELQTKVNIKALAKFLAESVRTRTQQYRSEYAPKQQALESAILAAMADPYFASARENLRYWQQLTALFNDSYSRVLDNIAISFGGSTANPPLGDRKQRLLRLMAAYLLYKKARAQLSRPQPARSSLQARPGPKLIEVANFGDRLITAVAVAGDGRLFVNFPHWREPFPEPSVAMVTAAGKLIPYPNETWNSWQPGQATQHKFVSVQSVHIDRNDQLWILDTGAPYFGKTIAGAAKLVQVDLATRAIVRIFRFDHNLASPDSYLNDVRIDPAGTHAYITDSRLGHLLVINLLTSRVRVLLRNHPSSKTEPKVSATVEGHELHLPDGQLFQPHCDGIALAGNYLYYRAVTSKTLYRIKTELLKDEWLAADQLHQAVEVAAKAGICDGMSADPNGNIYLTALDKNAIERITPAGKVETVIQDARLQWPDSLAMGPDRYLYIAVSQLHLIPFFHHGQDRRRSPHRIFKVKI